MDSGQISVLKEGHEISLGGFLQSHYSGTWEGDFNPDPQTGLAHQFDVGEVLNPINSISDGTVKIADQEAFLWWNDPLGAATNDYILLIKDQQGNLVGVANTTINGNEDPVQAATIPATGKYLQIVKRPGGQNRFLHLQVTNGMKLGFATFGATFGHNASSAANAISVGSVSAQGRQTPFTTGEKVDSWSSDGPRQLFYGPDGRPLPPNDLTHAGGRLVEKPDILAADCVNTDITGPPESITPFCGTSAAVAEAAGDAGVPAHNRLHEKARLSLRVNQLPQLLRQRRESLEQPAAIGGRQVPDAAEVDCEEREGDGRAGEGLGRHDGDLRTGMQVDAASAFPRDRAADHIDDAEHPPTLALDLLHCRQRIERLARLADGDIERIAFDHRVAVTELGSRFGIRRYPRQLFDQMGAEAAGDVGRAAAEDLDAADFQ